MRNLYCQKSLIGGSFAKRRLEHRRCDRMTSHRSFNSPAATDQSVVLIRRLNSGDSAALEKLFLKYQAILEQRISGKLRGHLSPLREDVVISTFRSFQRQFRDGRISNLEDCDSLLGMLTCIAV